MLLCSLLHGSTHFDAHAFVGLPLDDAQASAMYEYECRYRLYRYWRVALWLLLIARLVAGWLAGTPRAAPCLRTVGDCWVAGACSRQEGAPAGGSSSRRRGAVLGRPTSG